jgi:hypothetical protein
MLTKLTDLHTERSVYVDLDKAIAIVPIGQSDNFPVRTRIELDGAPCVMVLEAADEIAAMMQPATVSGTVTIDPLPFPL